MSKLSSDLKSNYQLFIEQILESGQVWALQSEQGWASCESENYQDTEVMPFWSEKNYAETYATEDWPEYHAVAITFESYLDDWLPGMIEDEVMVGVNWNPEFNDIEMESLVILDDLDLD